MSSQAERATDVVVVSVAPRRATLVPACLAAAVTLGLMVVGGCAPIAGLQVHRDLSLTDPERWLIGRRYVIEAETWLVTNRVSGNLRLRRYSHDPGTPRVRLARGTRVRALHIEGSFWPRFPFRTDYYYSRGVLAVVTDGPSAGTVFEVCEGGEDLYLPTETQLELLAPYVARRPQWAANVPAIAAALNDPDWAIRWLAAREAGWLGDQAEPLIASLARAVRDPDREVRDCAIRAIASLGRIARPALPALEAARRREDLDHLTFQERLDIHDAIASVMRQ